MTSELRRATYEIRVVDVKDAPQAEREARALIARLQPGGPPLDLTVAGMSWHTAHADQEAAEASGGKVPPVTSATVTLQGERKDDPTPEAAPRRRRAPAAGGQP